MTLADFDALLLPALVLGPLLALALGFWLGAAWERWRIRRVWKRMPKMSPTDE